MMIHQLRNSQLNVFSAFVCCTPFLVLYLLFSPRTLPAWDTLGNHPFFLPANNLVLLTVSCSIFSALVACLVVSGAFIAQLLQQARKEDKKLDFGPAFWNLLSICTGLLFLSVLVCMVFLKGPIILLAFLALVTLPVLFILLQVVSNMLRLRQGIREKSLSLRFMRPTLVPGLLGCSIIGMIFGVAFSQSFLTFQLALVGLILMSIIVGLLIYARKKILSISFDSQFLRFTLIPASLTVLAMFVILLMQLYHVWAIDTHVNALGWTRLNMPFMHVFVLGTALFTLLSCIFLWKAYRAQRKLVLA
jgi:hypothetical protein